MADSKKVMSWLEGLAEPDWMDCYSESEVQNTAIAALDLLDELLKEQDEEVRNAYERGIETGRKIKW